MATIGRKFNKSFETLVISQQTKGCALETRKLPSSSKISYELEKLFKLSKLFFKCSNKTFSWLHCNSYEIAKVHPWLTHLLVFSHTQQNGLNVHCLDTWKYCKS